MKVRVVAVQNVVVRNVIESIYVQSINAKCLKYLSFLLLFQKVSLKLQLYYKKKLIEKAKKPVHCKKAAFLPPLFPGSPNSSASSPCPFSTSMSDNRREAKIIIRLTKFENLKMKTNLKIKSYLMIKSVNSCSV